MDIESWGEKNLQKMLSKTVKNTYKYKVRKGPQLIKIGY